MNPALFARSRTAITGRVAIPMMTRGMSNSADLRHSDVFVSVMGDSAAGEAAIEGLQSAHGRIQAQIADQLRMKRTPTLSFRLDDTAAQAERVEEILRGQGDEG